MAAIPPPLNQGRNGGSLSAIHDGDAKVMDRVIRTAAILIINPAFIPGHAH